MTTTSSLKTVLITGATSGIGWGIAQYFAKAGMRVIINGLVDTPQQAADLIQQLESIQTDIDAVAVPLAHQFLPADLSNHGDIANMMQQAVQLGGVDILINNAGIQHVAPVATLSPAQWQAIIDINLSAVFHTSRAVLPTMLQRGWGRIINIASAHGLVASPMKSAYVAAKHGVLGFTKSLALEVATQGITCNAICPGYVRTPLVEAQIPTTAALRGISEAEVIDQVMMRLQATKQFVEIDDIAAMAWSLCGAHSNNITGSSLSIDGGWVAQ